MYFEQAWSPGSRENIGSDLQPLPGTSPSLEHPLVEPVPQGYKIGNYILAEQTDTVGDIQLFCAFHCNTREKYVCEVRQLLNLSLLFFQRFACLF